MHTLLNLASVIHLSFTPISLPIPPSPPPSHYTLILFCSLYGSPSVHPLTRLLILLFFIPHHCSHPVLSCPFTPPHWFFSVHCINLCPSIHSPACLLVSPLSLTTVHIHSYHIHSVLLLLHTLYPLIKLLLSCPSLAYAYFSVLSLSTVHTQFYKVHTILLLLHRLLHTLSPLLRLLLPFRLSIHSPALPSLLCLPFPFALFLFYPYNSALSHTLSRLLSVLFPVHPISTHPITLPSLPSSFPSFAPNSASP